MPTPDRGTAIARGHDCGLPVANERGERLVAIHPPEAPPTPPAAFSLVIASLDARVLLVRNRHRGVWELPGGWIEAGETAGDCALRELAEESAQAGRDARLLAWIVLAAPGTGIDAHGTGAIFSVEIDEHTAFLPTPEVSAIGYWPADALPAGVSGIDAALIARFSREDASESPCGPAFAA